MKSRLKMIFLCLLGLSSMPALSFDWRLGLASIAAQAIKHPKIVVAAGMLSAVYIYAQHLENQIQENTDKAFKAIRGHNNAISNRSPEHTYDALESILKHEINRNAQDANGDTLLILAIDSGDDQIISKILELGVNTEIKNKNGNTALLHALNIAFTKNELELLPYITIVNKLLKAGASQNVFGQDDETADQLIVRLHDYCNSMFPQRKTDFSIAQSHLFRADQELINAYAPSPLFLELKKLLFN